MPQNKTAKSQKTKIVRACTWLQLQELQLWRQWPLPSSSSSFPQPAVSQPEPEPLAQPLVSFPAGRWSAYPSAWPGQHCGAWRTQEKIVNNEIIENIWCIYLDVIGPGS